MTPADLLWHLAGFFAPALVVGSLSAGVSKLLWHGELARVSGWRLLRAATVAAAAVLVTGLVAFGRDGKMLTYGGVVVASALALWWTGFRRSRR